VFENKGNQFSKCSKLRAFRAQINRNLTENGATEAAFCENLVRTGESCHDPLTVTISRLDKREICIVAAWPPAGPMRLIDGLGTVLVNVVAGP